MQKTPRKRARSPDAIWCADRFEKAVPPGSNIDSEIAARCGITKSGVSNWRSDGSYRKSHIWVLADMTKTPIEYWIPPPANDLELPARLSPAMDQAFVEAWRILHAEQRRALIAEAKKMAKENKKVLDHASRTTKI